MLLSKDQYAELQTLVFYFNASVYFTIVNGTQAHYFHLMVESLNSSTSLHCSSTSLCYISLDVEIKHTVATLFMGGRLCRPLLWLFLAFHPHFLAKCVIYIYISPKWRKKLHSEILFQPLDRLLLLEGIAAVLGLRCSCGD